MSAPAAAPLLEDGAGFGSAFFGATEALHRVCLPPNCARDPKAGAFAATIEGALTREDCEALIQKALPRLRYVDETKGVRIQSPRAYRLAVVEDAAIVAKLWSALEMIPGSVGLNPRLRILSYADGERFEPHFDFQVRTDHTESRLTVLVYLSDDFRYGETFFLDSHEPFRGRKARVEPKVGRLLVFDHELYHVGAPVVVANERQRGKVVLRSDVLFPVVRTAAPRRPPPEEEKKKITHRRRILRVDDVLPSDDDHHPIRRALESLGLLETSLDALRDPGRDVVHAILAEFDDIPQPDIDPFLDALFDSDNVDDMDRPSSSSPAYLRANVRSNALDLDSWRPQ